MPSEGEAIKRRYAERKKVDRSGMIAMWIIGTSSENVVRAPRSLPLRAPSVTLQDAENTDTH